jgi:hypothetical protein
VSPEFLLAQEASENQVEDNIITDNGANPDPSHPFAPFASDIALLTAGDHGNQFCDNEHATVASLIGVLPECAAP